MILPVSFLKEKTKIHADKILPPRLQLVWVIICLASEDDESYHKEVIVRS